MRKYLMIVVNGSWTKDMCRISEAMNERRG